MFYVEGFDPQEIALVTSYPLQTVQAALASVRQKLRQRLSEQKIA